MVFVEVGRRSVERVHHDESTASRRHRSDRAPESIDEQLGPEPATLKIFVQRKACQED